MKKSEVIPLLIGLREVATYPGAKFAYAIARNINTITPEAEIIERVTAYTPAFIEYDQARVKLAEQFAELDGKGKPKIIGQAYVFTVTGRFQFDEALKPLNEEHKEALDARKVQIKESAELLAEESDVTLHKITPDMFPEGITASQIVAIMPIVEEPI